MPSAPIARATWMGRSVDPYFGISARLHAARAARDPRVVEVLEDVGLAHRRAEDDRRCAARCSVSRREPGVVDRHARGGERHREQRPVRRALGRGEVVARRGSPSPRRRTARPSVDASNASTGEMPLLPAASARKKASLPEPDRADDADARDEHASRRHLAPERL